MKNFQILTDRVADLPDFWIKTHKYITVIDTPVIISGHHNLVLHNLTANDFDQVEHYVKQYGDHAVTSQPQIYGKNMPFSVESLTRKYVEAGKDVIYIAMNSALSGTYSTVSICYNELSEWAKEKGRKILCVDSHCMSTGLALLFLELAEEIERKSIQDIKSIYNFVVKERSHIGHFFTWRELSYIRRSGRVNAGSAALATLLGIRLFCSAQYREETKQRKLEHVNPNAKIRGLAKYSDILGIYAKKHITDPNGPIIIAHGNAPKDAEVVHQCMLKYFPNATYLIGKNWRCGAGIQVHGGPTSLHINFRTDNVGYFTETKNEIEAIIRSTRRK